MFHFYEDPGLLQTEVRPATQDVNATVTAAG